MENKEITVAVGMSGGVDSSVAAYLLKAAGYRVIGLFMRNWEEEDENCPAAKDFQDVVSVCATLDIPYYTINFAEQYYESVFASFLEGLKRGITPNPDVFCNKEIKFKVFLEKAMQIGADYLATGHYAKIGKDYTLERASDLNKDQSYFLYTLKSEQLKKVLFPLENLTKPEIRAIAKDLGLVTSDKKDSTGICFIGKRKFKEFIENFIIKTPGNFLNEKGKVIGKHDGLSYYTIGQRKGLGIGGEGDAWFVAKKDIASNTITLVQGHEHPMLYKRKIEVIDLEFVSGHPPLPLNCTAKVRYRSEDTPCQLKAEEGKMVVEFTEAVFAPTPGQSIVFYQGSTCLGGAIIE
jgi:tRNA-specific 2-thiouridylase